MSPPVSAFDVILHHPEIPPNTGNIIRLCANTGCRLHLIEPLGFSLDTKALRRAGLDYHEFTELQTYPDLRCCYQALGIPDTKRVFACTTHGTQLHTDVAFAPGDALLFGSESAGLPAAVHLDPALTGRLRLPMRADSRSLNLSNAVAVVVFEAWRQCEFAGGN